MSESIRDYHHDVDAFFKKKYHNAKITLNLRKAKVYTLWRALEPRNQNM